MTVPIRSIRLLPQTTGRLNSLTASRGEVFYDAGTNSLRLFDGVTTGGTIIGRNTEQLQDLVAAMFTGSGGNVTAAYDDSQGKISLTASATGLSVSYNNLTDRPTFATVATSGSYNDLTDKPTVSGFSGNYNDLIGKPNLADVATSGDYLDLINLPTLFSGNYDDLINKPIVNATLSSTDSANPVTLSQSGLGITNGDTASIVLDNGAIKINYDGKESQFTADGFVFPGGTFLATTLGNDTSGTLTIRANDGTTFGSAKIDLLNNYSGGSVIGLYVADSPTNYINVQVGSSEYRFTTTGLQFPNSTVQTSAYEGGPASVIVNQGAVSGTVANNLNLGRVFYYGQTTGNITANFTNVPTTDSRRTQVTVVINQGASPRSVSAVQIDGVAQTVYWKNQQVPTVTSFTDVYRFTFERVSGAWRVYGEMDTYSIVP